MDISKIMGGPMILILIPPYIATTTPKDWTLGENILSYLCSLYLLGNQCHYWGNLMDVDIWKNVSDASVCPGAGFSQWELRKGLTCVEVPMVWGKHGKVMNSLPSASACPCDVTRSQARTARGSTPRVCAIWLNVLPSPKCPGQKKKKIIYLYLYISVR